MSRTSIKNKYGSRALKPLLPTVIKRGHTKVIELKFKNVGSAAWYDIGKKRLLPKGHKPVVLQRVDAKIDDFYVKMGERSDKTDKKFKKVTGRKNHLGIAEPGDTVVLSAMVTAKKFVNRGRHKLSFRLAFLDGDTADGFEVVDKNIWVWFFSWEIFWRDVKRLIKLMLIKPGRVSYEFENSVFTNHKEKTNNTPVIMCVWNRPENLSKIIDLLRKQSESVDFYIWNNNKNLREFVDKTVAAEENLRIRVSHSKYNIGGYGRFYQARAVNDKNAYVIFIDDDQTFNEHMVSDFLKEAKPKTILSQWAFRFTDSYNYWKKVMVDPGATAHYCGTGGLIADSAIFTEEEVFDCPKRFWFIEDLWLSFVAEHHHNWTLRRAKVELDIEDDHQDQMNQLIDKKSRMLRYLIKLRKWNSIKNA